MPSRPRYYKSNPSDAPIMILTMTSETMGTGEIYDIASTRLAQRIAQIEGLVKFQLVAARSCRTVELNPTLFNQGVSLDAVRSAISSANVRQPQGYINDDENVIKYRLMMS